MYSTQASSQTEKDAADLQMHVRLFAVLAIKSATYEPESKHTVERDWGTAETQGLYMYRGAECSSKYLSARWIPPSLSIGNCQQQTTPCSVLLGQPKGCSLTTVPSLLFCSQSHTGAPLEVCESRKKRTRSGT